MKILQHLLLAAATLGCGACASTQSARHHGADRSAVPSDHDAHLQETAGGAAIGASVELVVDTQTTSALHLASGADAADGPAPSSPMPDALSEAELDASGLYTEVVVRDPWERYNRRVHRINNVVDRYVLRPVAVGYTKVMPAPVRSGVSRFFGNLGVPTTAVNQALQGRPVHALQSLGRFALNTTLGIGGVLDPAARMGIVQRSDEDFGQTLAVWGWHDSRYLVMPLLGPRTVRDALAIVGDQKLAPIGYVNDSGTAGALQVLDTVDGRSQWLQMDATRREAYDEYALVRDAWAQRRRYLIERDRPGQVD